MTEKINHDFIKSLFYGILHRAPRDNELVHWNSVISKGLDLRLLPEKLMESKEFQRLIARKGKHFVEPGHFYSPLVNVDQIRARFEKSDTNISPEAIRINPDTMRTVWYELLPFLQDTPFPEESSPGYRYFFRNPAFSYGDGSILHAMLRRFRPNRIVEVGSGYSSACTIDTIDNYIGSQVEVSFIEPYPELLINLLGADRAAQCKIHINGVQDADPKVFSQLKDGDFLFIDSTHVMKTGSDVCHELFNILPKLNPGVFIHFHDIFWPFEYPSKWVLAENRSWNEIYGLRAFLMYNNTFEVIFFNDWFARHERNLIRKEYPAMLMNTGGSIWLRKSS
jgi:hypothetical protein